MIVHQRSEWGARPPKQPGVPFDGQLGGIAVHWNGPAVTSGPAALLRADQNFHMDTRGWNDIAYNVAVDSAGEIWIARGLGVRSAANGDQTVNAKWGAVLCMIGQGQTPTAAMLAGLRDAVGLFAGTNHLPNPAVTTHHDIYAAGTECPGPDLLAFVHAGLPTPTPKESDMPAVLVNLEGQPEIWCVGPAGRWYVGHPKSVDLLGFTGVAASTVVTLHLADGGADALRGIPIVTPTPVDVSALATAIVAKLPVGSSVDAQALAAAVVAELGLKLTG